MILHQNCIKHMSIANHIKSKRRKSTWINPICVWWIKWSKDCNILNCDLAVQAKNRVSDLPLIMKASLLHFYKMEMKALEVQKIRKKTETQSFYGGKTCNIQGELSNMVNSRRLNSKWESCLNSWARPNGDVYNPGSCSKTCSTRYCLGHL